MVARGVVTAAWCCVALQAKMPLWMRLGPQDRVRVLAALAALLILGFGLVVFAWWGARVTRRYMNVPPRTPPPDAWNRIDVNDWASKPLVPEDEEETPRR